MDVATTRGALRGVLAGLVLLGGIAVEGRAQAVIRVDDVRVGTDEERYLRALAITRPADPLYWAARPLHGPELLAALVAERGPWVLDTAHRTLSMRGASVDLALNSDRPSARGDGGAWSGRGANARVSGSVEWRRGAFSARAAPLLWWAQNASYALLPTFTGAPFVDPLRPLTIDLPQRFGDGPLARLDPGESFVSWQGPWVRASVTTAAARLGPGVEHALLMQGDNGGYPRAEVATSRWLPTPVGALQGAISWGRTAQSSWAPEARSGAQNTSHIMATWRPPLTDRLEIGMLRVTHVDWKGLQLRDLLIPMGSLYETAWAGGEDLADNQLASFFGRLRVPEAGLEFFGEYAKNDRAPSLRGYVLETDHAAAWLLGLQRVWRDDAERLWSLNATLVDGAISPVTEWTFQSTFFDHFPLAQGHTLRGRLLGSSLLEREGGAELRIDRYDPRGRVGFIVGTRTLTNQYAAAVDPALQRQEYSAMLEVTRWSTRHAGVWRTRVGAVADLGYSPVTGDAYTLHVGVGYSQRR